MLISHAAISAWLIGFPRFGPSAWELLRPRASTSAMAQVGLLPTFRSSRNGRAATKGELRKVRTGKSKSPLGRTRPLRRRDFKSAALGVDMFDLAVAFDRPAGDAVVVLTWKAEDIWNGLGFPAFGDDLRAGRLHVPGLVPGAALQDRRTAVPVPGHAKAGESLAQYRRLKRRLRPALSAVGRYHDLRDPSGAGIGHA